MRVWSLGWEALLEKGMAIHPSILAWRIPWKEEPGRLQSIGLQRVGCDWSNLVCTHVMSSTSIHIVEKVAGFPSFYGWILFYLSLMASSLVAQTVKSLLIMWETGVLSLGQEYPLEKEMATHSSTLAWKIPWMEEHGRLQSMGLQRVRHGWTTSLGHLASYYIGSI